MYAVLDRSIIDNHPALTDRVITHAVISIHRRFSYALMYARPGNGRYVIAGLGGVPDFINHPLFIRLKEIKNKC
jgi:hypothetical protein